MNRRKGKTMTCGAAGRKGGKATLKKYGPALYTRASNARWERVRARLAKAQRNDTSGEGGLTPPTSSLMLLAAPALSWLADAYPDAGPDMVLAENGAGLLVVAVALAVCGVVWLLARVCGVTPTGAGPAEGAAPGPDTTGNDTTERRRRR